MGDGTFRDVTAETHLDRVFMPMGSNFGDIDNDGFLDIYLGTGNPSYGSLLPNVLLHNHDGKYFTDATASSGTGELHKGHGVAFADLGNNGREDLLEEVGGAVPGDRHAFRLFKNPGNDNDWITVHLVGVKSNRSAIGARIKVTVQDGDQAPRTIYRTVGSGGSFGASPLQQHIGIGKIGRIHNLEIWWRPLTLARISATSRPISSSRSKSSIPLSPSSTASPTIWADRPPPPNPQFLLHYHPATKHIASSTTRQ